MVAAGRHVHDADPRDREGGSRKIAPTSRTRRDHLSCATNSKVPAGFRAGSRKMREDHVSIWQSIKLLFASPSLPDPTAGWKLDASTEDRLSQSLDRLPAGDKGWIDFAEAHRLFSAVDPEYAFGETDQDGSRKLATFATKHQSDINFMPGEGRIYFLSKRR
jgi:hypothetical protein